MARRIDFPSLRHRIVLADGAWGTELQRRGLAPGDVPDLWNLTKPDAVRDVAFSYAEAGSRIVLTNTFCTSRVFLERFGRGHEAAALAEAGARLSKEGAGPGVFVFGSVGPIAWQGVSPRKAKAAFTEKTLALCRGGVDAIVLETFMDLEEARAALDCALATSLPVVVSLTYGWGEDGRSTARGVTARRAAEELASRGISALGANCGDDFATLCRVVRTYREVWDGPVWVKPSAGIPQWTDGSATYDMAPDEFARGMRRLVDAGANIVGGCCGTTPEFIAATRRELGDRLSG